jgi:hypothetical protein
VIKPSFGHVSQVSGEELDDENRIVRPACPTREAVVLQPNTGIGFTIIIDDVVRRSKTLREAHVAHVSPQRLGTQPIRAKVVPFSITTPTAMWVVCTVLRACPSSPYQPDDAPEAQGIHPGGPA